MAEMGQLPASPATAGKPTAHLLVSRENYKVLLDGRAVTEETRRRCQRFRNQCRHGIDGHPMVLERAADEASVEIENLKDWSVDSKTHMKRMETGPPRAHMS
jgi:hypothetical protein